MDDITDKISVETLDDINIDTKMVYSVLAFLKSEIQFHTENLVVVFVDNKFIYNMNEDFLGHNYFTDIITFGYSEKPYIVDGELYISVDEAEKNAGLYGAGLNEELIRLIIHGLLHLVGLDDTETGKKIKMKRTENYLLKKYLNKVKQ